MSAIVCMRGTNRGSASTKTVSSISLTYFLRGHRCRSISLASSNAGIIK